MTHCSQFTIGPEPANDKINVFKAFWNEMDKHYVYFDIKGIDWKQVYNNGLQKLQSNPDLTELELCIFYKNILVPFYDGHLSMSTPNENTIDISSYGRWLDVSEYGWEYLFDFNIYDLAGMYLQEVRIGCSGNIVYGNVDSTTGYMYIDNFRDEFNQDNLDKIFEILSLFRKLIIDIRSNNGGYLKSMNQIASKLVRERIVYGYKQAKSGPGHFDFTELKPLVIVPDKKFRYEGKVVVLINADVNSAAEHFALAMKTNNYPLVGTRTAGCIGSKSFKELPNGWILFYPCTRLLNLDKQLVENVGISPDIAVKADPDSIQICRDEILEEALLLLKCEVPKGK